jgi:hypothetical protein
VVTKTVFKFNKECAYGSAFTGKTWNECFTNLSIKMDQNRKNIIVLEAGNIICIWHLNMI